MSIRKRTAKKPKLSKFDRSANARKGAIHRRLTVGPGSIPEMKRLSVRLERALRARGYSPFVSQETAFHMVDWLGNLMDLHDLYTGRSRWTSERVEKILIGFLVHVPNHVAAAAKVLADSPVSDLFEVGAIKGSVPKRTTAQNPWSARTRRQARKR